MRSRLMKLLLLVLAGAGAMKLLRASGVTAPATSSPQAVPRSADDSVRPVDNALPASEPFSDPLGEPEGEGAAKAADVPIAGKPSGQEPGVALVDPEPAPTGAAAVTDAPAPSPAAAADALVPLPEPPHGPFATAPDDEPDDLKRISGVGPKLESMLNEQGITTFAQLAELDDAGIDELQARLPQFPGRIRRDDWVGQAAQLRSS